MRILLLFILVSIPGLFSFQLSDSVELSKGIEKISTCVVVNGFAYYGTSSLPGYVVKVDLSNFSLVSSLKFDNRIYSSIVYYNYAYFGTDTTSILKIDLSNFTFDSKLQIPTGPSTYATINGETAIFGNQNGYLAQVNLTSFTLLNGHSISASVSTAIVYNNYAYLTPRSASYILKYSLDSNTVVGNISLGAQYNNFYFGLVQANFAYFGGDSGIVKVNLDTLQLVSSNTNYGVKSGVLYGGNAYFGFYNSIQLNSTTLIESSNTITTLSSTGTSNALTAFAYDNYIYYGMNSSPASIIKMHPNGTIVSTLLLDSITTYLGAAISDGYYAYWTAGTMAFDNQIIVIRLDDFRTLQVLNITAKLFKSSFLYGNRVFFGNDAGNLLYYNIVGGNVDYVNYPFGGVSCGFFYGTNGYFGQHNGNIIRMDINTLTINGTIAVGSIIECAVMSGKYGYFGTYDSIVKVDLDTFSIVGNITSPLILGYAFLYGNYAYFITGQTSQSKVFQVDLPSFTLVANVSLTYGISSFVVNGSYLYAGTTTGSIVKIDIQTWQNETIQTTYSEVTFNSAIMYQNVLYFGGNSATAPIIKISLSNETFPSSSSTASSSTITSSSSTAGTTGTTSSTTVDSTASPSTTSGEITSTDGNDTISSTTGDFASISSHSSSNVGVVVGSVIGSIVAVTIFAALLLFLLKKRRKPKPTIEENSKNSVEMDLESLPIIKDVVIKNILGSGNFGEVYRGEWKVRNFLGKFSR